MKPTENEQSILMWGSNICSRISNLNPCPTKYNKVNGVYYCMEVEIELITTETDETKVKEKVTELTRKAEELGFTVKEVEIENE